MKPILHYTAVRQRAMFFIHEIHFSPKSASGKTFASCILRVCWFCCAINFEASYIRGGSICCRGNLASASYSSGRLKNGTVQIWQVVRPIHEPCSPSKQPLVYEESSLESGDGLSACENLTTCCPRTFVWLVLAQHLALSGFMSLLHNPS